MDTARDTRRVYLWRRRSLPKTTSHRAKLTALGMLTLLLLLFRALPAPVADVAAPRPQTLPDAAPDAAAWEAGR